MTQEIHMPNQEEQLDFFVKTTWTKDDEDDDKTEPQKEKKPKTKDDETVAAEDEITKEEKDSGILHKINHHQKFLDKRYI